MQRDNSRDEASDTRLNERGFPRQPCVPAYPMRNTILPRYYTLALGVGLAWSWAWVWGWACQGDGGAGRGEGLLSVYSLSLTLSDIVSALLGTKTHKRHYNA
jgi:hypothetical protein